MQSASTDSADVHVVESNCSCNKVVGPTPHINLSVGDVDTRALVDSGSQATIISRGLLHKIARKAHSDGNSLPSLKLPTVKLFGKGGPNDHRQLNITAQVELEVSVDGQSAKVPVLVQPDSNLECLLGMNVIPKLGIQFLRANGQHIDVESSQNPQVAHVRLLQSITIPARKARFVDAVVEGDYSNGDEMIFEPDCSVLQDLGLSSTGSLVTVQPGGKVLIPLHNHLNNCISVKEQVVMGAVQIVEAEQIQMLVDKNGRQEVESNPELTEPGQRSGVVNLLHSDVDRREQMRNMLNLPDEGLSEPQLKKLETFLIDSNDVFSLHDDDLGRTSLVKHSVDTGDHAPIKQPPRRLPFSQRETVSNLVDDMMKKGIIQPSVSAWASPIVLVPKRDNTLRFCVDYRKVNAITKKDVYPLPRIDDILDTLGKSRYFTTLDLASGFWQIEMDPATREKSAFTTHCGLHEFIRMPFGMCNAPATFQRLMQVVLAGIEWKFCFVYLDDILVCSSTFEEHMQHLSEVFARLRKACLTLKPRKCSFARTQVVYLGHVISVDGVLPDPEKTNKVRAFPVPKDVTSLRQFLGLASYYRRFVPGFSTIACPLHRLLKKDAVFEWSTDCQSSFEKLKRLLTTAPLLAYPRFGLGEKFTLETDASLEGLGAVLSQVQEDGLVHPVAFASRSLQPHEKNYSITELETLGLVWAVKHFRPYLLGHHTTVYTDHSACTSLLNSPKPSAKLARWAMIIQEFDLAIKHRSGRSNSNADALSRNPVSEGDALVRAVSAQESWVSSSGEQKDMIEHQEKDVGLRPILAYLKEGTLPEEETSSKKLVLEATQYDIINGVLCHENPNKPGSWRIVVPSDMRLKLLEELHGGKFSGHFAWRKLYNTMKNRFWWRGMCGDVEKHCRSCLECVTRRGSGRASHPPLSPIPVGGPFHRLGVDVLQLPQTEAGNRYLLVFVDYLTKWVEAFPMQDQSAETIARLLVTEIFCRHGAPEQLLSDRGANFLSDLLTEVCKMLNIDKVNTSGYHPQTDGLVEKMNSTVIAMLSKVVETSGRDWDKHLPFILFAYRAAVHDSTRESPFFLLYGRDPRLPNSSVLSQISSPYLVDSEDYKEELVACLTSARNAAKECIKGAQEKQKRAYDKKAKDHSYRVGDRVMIHMPSAMTGKAWKLARPFHGPYRVLGVTPSNIEARLVDDSSAESIFVSVNRVRPCYSGVPDTSWTGYKRKKKKNRSKKSATSQEVKEYSGPVTRSRSKNK